MSDVFPIFLKTSKVKELLMLSRFILLFKLLVPLELQQVKKNVACEHLLNGFQEKGDYISLTPRELGHLF